MRLWRLLHKVCGSDFSITHSQSVSARFLNENLDGDMDIVDDYRLRRANTMRCSSSINFECKHFLSLFVYSRRIRPQLVTSDNAIHQKHCAKPITPLRHNIMRRRISYVFPAQPRGIQSATRIVHSMKYCRTYSRLEFCGRRVANPQNGCMEI